METIISSFLLVFLAEIGDKTQFLSMIFATRYKIYQVILGIFLGVFFNHGLAVLLAKFLSSLIDLEILKIIAGIMFLIFGFESFVFKLKDEENNDISCKFCAVMTVSICFFIGELGDKTQITAMSIVFTGKNPILTLIGTTLGMLCVSLFGIMIGKIIKGRIPTSLMKKISGVCFVIFGIKALNKAVPEKYMTNLNIMIFYIGIITVLSLIFLRNFILKQSLNNK